MYLCMFVCMYVCMHVCMYACMYACTDTPSPIYFLYSISVLNWHRLSPVFRINFVLRACT